jgi:hypothetical protein
MTDEQFKNVERLRSTGLALATSGQTTAATGHLLTALYMLVDDLAKRVTALELKEEHKP